MKQDKIRIMIDEKLRKVIINMYIKIQFNSIQFSFFIDQLRALKGQQENCTLMNKQYAQQIDTGGKELYD